MASSVTAGIKRTLPWDFNVNVKTPQLRNRVMEKLILNNRLSVLLISDPSTPHVGAALSVESGSWSDGLSEGTAHFLEHMLFLGTAKYPKENDYERFIYDNNGVLNAYTSSDHTMYFFTNVTPNALEGALDRFSRFFYEPLFNESCVEREQNAVDQEFRKNIEQDGWRMLHVRKELSNQSHPFSQFNTGNLDTMKLIDQAYLKNWYAEKYSANAMNLVVMGKEPINELRDLVVKYFSAVPDTKLKPLVTEGMKIFPESLKGCLVAIEPIKDLKELTLSWEIPFEYSALDTKPGRLAGHVLGYEGQNSLLSLLKREGLAEGLSAGRSEMGSQNLLFEISVTLTEAGVANYKSVIERVFAAIGSFQAQPYPEYLVTEINSMSKVGYEFQQRSANIVTSVCRSIRREGIESFPAQSTFISRFDRDAIHRLFGILKPDTCTLYMIAKKQHLPIPLDKKEKWMGGLYGVAKVNASDLKIWTNVQPHPEISYPAPNRFIPDNLVLVSSQASSSSVKADPQLIVNAPEGRLYHHTDDTFFVPESLYNFTLRSPAIQPDNPKSLALADLYIRFVHERLNEISYDATSAGLHYDVYTKEGTGIGISIDGYSQKSHILLREVLARVKAPQPTVKEFNIFKESLTRSYRNISKESPLRQAMEKLSAIIYRKFSTSAAIADAMDIVTFSDVQTFISNLFSNRIVEGYVGGNVLAPEAVRAWELLLNSLPGVPCNPELVKKSEVVLLPNTRPMLYSTPLDVKGNAVVWVCDSGEKSDYWARTGQDMLGKLMREPFYSELRTKQQTGYIVSSGTFMANKRLFIQAAVQSNTHDARDLLSRIELFMEGFTRTEIQESETIQSRFDSIKSASLVRLLEPHDTLAGRERFLGYCAFEEDGRFDLIERRIEALKSFTLSDLKTFAMERLGRGNKRRLSVITEGNDTENTSMSYVLHQNVNELRAKL
ncbi:hypothetical protein SmJEL517_g05695 [Synchytrium microbalum]|uniref:Uncharacterized protein n=1 Tax=Synchytrium microbalum TaxID=1806994 RepID=A0A507BV32_9FUNG|nr:uncharacterized protein SmJEL517_g05695 [Synchytrium microbalum]TPX30829.1 hypothetical protein SmJEL517_g05695 [Synchytrium microbalum]